MTSNFLHNYISQTSRLNQMNSIYRAISSRQQNKNTISLFGVKTATIKHRNFSNSRLISPHYFIDTEFNKDSHQIERRQLTEKDNSTNKSGDLKKYCFNRLKNSQETKMQGIKKNSSLKVIRRTDSHTFFNKSKIPKVTDTEHMTVKPEEKYNNQLEKGKSISIKRRVELIKKNQTKLKLIEKAKDNYQFKEVQKSDVSFAEGFQKCVPDFEKTSVGNKIWSENVLGQGLKKSSSSKIKILVKNPFQKLMRQEQQKNLYLKYPSELQTPIAEMKQSQILSKLQESSTSIAQRCQLQQMLAMM